MTGSAPDHGCGAQNLKDDTNIPKIREIALRLAPQIKTYGADTKRSWLQLISTAVPFFVLLGTMVAVTETAYWLTLLLAPITAGLLVRLFIIQHDCGHGAFFKTRKANDAIGNMISVFTLTPYEHWRRGHTYHHASSGNLDRRGQGDVETRTVAEYEAMTPLGRLGYRIYRSPVAQIFVGAAINFIILQRLPLGRGFRDSTSRRSIMMLNLALVFVFGIPMALIGVKPVIAAYLPMMWIAAIIGGWLFYVQHQFDGTYWRKGDDWNFHEASLDGSTFFDLPPILQWFTGNIGMHHIHHLCSTIPNYRLQECMDTYPELRETAKRIDLRESIKCWSLSLWDEEHSQLISFRDLEAQRA